MRTLLRNRIRIRTQLGELLLKDGILRESDLKSALERQKHTRAFLGEVLIEMDFMSEKVLGPYVAKVTGYPFVTLADHTINTRLARTIPANFSRQHRVLAFGMQPHGVEVAMADPLNYRVTNSLLSTFQRPLLPFLAFETDISKAIDQVYDMWNAFG